MEPSDIFLVIGIYKKCGYADGFDVAVVKDDIESVFTADRSMDAQIKSGGFAVYRCILIEKCSDNGVIFRKIDTDHIKVSKICRKLKRKNDSLQELLKNERMPFLNDTLPFAQKGNLSKSSSSDAETLLTVEVEPVNVNDVFQGKFKVLGPRCEDVSVSQVDDYSLKDVDARSFKNRHKLTSVDHASPTAFRTSIESLRPGVTRPFLAKIIQKTRINTAPYKYNPFFFVIASFNNIYVKILFWKEHLEKYSELAVGDVIYVQKFSRCQGAAEKDVLVYNTFTESMYFSCQEIKPYKIYRVTNELFENTKLTTLFDKVQGEVTYTSTMFSQTYNGAYMQFKYMIVKSADGPKRVMLFNNSQQEFYEDGNNNVMLTEMRRIIRGGYEVYISTIYTQIKILKDCFVKEKRFFNAVQNEVVRGDDVRYTYGGIAFLPDGFKSVDELKQSTELFKGKSKGVEVFMWPNKTTVEDLARNVLDVNKANCKSEESGKEDESTEHGKVTYSQKLFQFVINEVKKFYFTAKITGIEEDDLVFDYAQKSDNKELKTFGQGVHKVCINGKHYVYLAGNFFCETNLLEQVQENMNKECVIFVDGLRVGPEEVFIYITGIIKIN